MEDPITRDIERIGKRLRLPGMPMPNLRRAQMGRLREFREALPTDITHILPPAPTARQMELTAMGAAADVADWLLGMIPVYGDIAADIVVDNIEANMRRRFTEPERPEFIEQSRFLPSSVAAYRAVERVQQREAP